MVPADGAGRERIGPISPPNARVDRAAQVLDVGGALEHGSLYPITGKVTTHSLLICCMITAGGVRQSVVEPLISFIGR